MGRNVGQHVHQREGEEAKCVLYISLPVFLSRTEHYYNPFMIHQADTHSHPNRLVLVFHSCIKCNFASRTTVCLYVCVCVCVCVYVCV